ncbi:MAG: hypothetical protein Q8Q09_00280 [Deltaproteobacteria bacterium]|nr:hypothetical protein [Deltaproteobacteria bacterium]
MKSQAIRWCARGLSLSVTLAWASAAQAETRRLTEADVRGVSEAVRTAFEAVRDGDTPRLRTVVATREDFVRLFVSGTVPFIEWHQRAIERDARELRGTFASGTFVSLGPAFVVGASVRLDRCGRFGARASRCTDGPIIEYRVGTLSRRFRVDRLVRLADGTWKIFDLRM